MSNFFIAVEWFFNQQDVNERWGEAKIMTSEQITMCYCREKIKMVMISYLIWNLE